MIPSAHRMISSIFLIPSAFSIFAMIGIFGAWHSLRNARISKIHSALRTKEAAIKSIFCCAPKRISSLSFSVIAGSLTGTFGTFTPLRSPSSPPLTTVQMISFSFFAFTRSPIRPSSISIVLPTCTSSTSPPYVMETRSASPFVSSVVRVNVSPVFSVTFFPSFNTPVRISGPLVSRRIAIGLPSSSRTFLSLSIRAFCSSCVP